MLLCFVKWTKLFFSHRLNLIKIYTKGDKTLENIKANVAKNITQLRLAKGMTQLELAETLNYSDKAVSKWERGDSIPDITVLTKIADMFGVTLDYLVRPHKEADDSGMKLSAAKQKKNRIFITGMCMLLVWLIATLCFVIATLLPVESSNSWLAFLYAVPATMIVWLVFNSVWFSRRLNFLIISMLMWSTLVSIHLSFLVAGFTPFWLVYLLGIPGQIIIFMWSGISFRSSSSSADKRWFTNSGKSKKNQKLY